MSLQLGTFGAWFNPAYDDDARVRGRARRLLLGHKVKNRGDRQHDIGHGER